MGAFGNGLASSLTNFINYICISILVKQKAKKETLVPFNGDSFKGFKEFFHVALPSSLMICLETWNYQITALMTGYLNSKTQIAGNIILLNLGLFFYMF